MRVLVENGFVNKIRSLKPATLVAMVVVLGLALAVPVTIYQTQQRQDLQQSAATPNEAFVFSGKPSPCVNLGDIDGDGIITIKQGQRGTPPIYVDAELINQYVAGTTKLTPQQISIADVDADGNVTAADALKVARFAQGLETTFPICAKTTRVTPLICGYYGDINGDKRISELDAWEIQKHLTYFPSLLKDNSYLQKAADVNADGKVDITDPLLIANYVNGRTNTFVACTKTKAIPSTASCSIAPAPGDVDGDGLVTNLDAQMVGIHVTGLTPITDATKLKNADADANGKIDMVDALFIARFAEGLDATLKGCTVVRTPSPTQAQSIYCRRNSDCPANYTCGVTNFCFANPTPTPVMPSSTPTPSPIQSMTIRGSIFQSTPSGSIPAPVGTTLQAYINGVLCGQTQTTAITSTNLYTFNLTVNSASLTPGCGTASGGLITFKVNGIQMSNTSAFSPGASYTQGFTLPSLTTPTFTPTPITLP